MQIVSECAKESVKMSESFTIEFYSSNAHLHTPKFMEKAKKMFKIAQSLWKVCEECMRVCEGVWESVAQFHS